MTRFRRHPILLLIALALALAGPSAAGAVSPAAAEPVAFVSADHSDPGAQLQKTVTVPANAVAGQTLLLAFTHRTAVAWTGPGGVTGWREARSATTDFGLTSTVWTKTVADGDAGATVSFDAPDYAKGMLTLALYSGVDPGPGVDIAYAVDAAETTVHTTPVLSGRAGALTVSYWVDRGVGTTSWALASGGTVRDVALGTGGGRYSSLLADSPSADGPVGGLTAETPAPSQAVSWTVVLRPTAPPSVPGPTKVLVIWEENESAVTAFPAMPYLTSLSTTFGKATAYRGDVHPSLGNYLVAASGRGEDTCGLHDPLPALCSLPGQTVFGAALAAGRTAKTYAEAMTTNCQRTNSPRYAARHNPWTYFPDEAAACTSLDVPLGTTTAGELADDVTNGTLPDVSMVIPDLINDAHDGSLLQADNWLRQWVPVLMSGPDYRSGKLAIIVTFDEGIGLDQNVPFVVVSPDQRGRVVNAPFDHYALGRLLTDMVGVAPLGGGATATGLRSAFGL
ncbi:MAG TPA: alkaline phosphatase family protein [Intrasporangium sp.]|uniref:alkaline phosphatase family protein n=1 Tax=Intrasporangium sp. TaxID=1925024 RepID=UPI002D77AB9B|nr:alkaline phosphatase family protein [Intrasporangium sp.]HET7399415.1 alkaline phosphatase family protein [Intrasporangium sp.]